MSSSLRLNLEDMTAPILLRVAKIRDMESIGTISQALTGGKLTYRSSHMEIMLSRTAHPKLLFLIQVLLS